MSALEIPDKAVQIVAGHCFGDPRSDGTVSIEAEGNAARETAAQALADAAPIIVAAAFRQFAEAWGVTDQPLPGHVPWQALQTYADELDPPGDAYE